MMLDAPGKRTLLGSEAHLRLAEAGIGARIDGCERCVADVVERLVSEPLAAVALRRLAQLRVGLYGELVPRGGPEEAIDVQAVIDFPEQAREVTGIILGIMAESLTVPASRGPKRGKRKPVRHPGRRARGGQG